MRLLRDVLHKYRGITIVELLVASTIAIVAFAMAANIYIAAKNNYSELNDKVATDTKELITKRLLHNFVKSSGFACGFGYINQTYHNNTGDTLDSYFTSGSSIIVGPMPFANGSSFASALEDECTGDCFKAGSDYIMVKKEDSHTELTAANSSSDTLAVSSVAGISSGDYLALCNKDDVDLVKVDTVDSENNLLSLVEAPSSILYQHGDYVGKYSLQILYIRDTGEQDNGGDDIYSLYVYEKDNDSSGRSHELVRGIENMRVEYATVDSGSIVWSHVASDTGIDSAGYSAMKVTFQIDGKDFSKIVVL